ncbi:MAG: phosphate propanoyltransferase [bacterium]
MTVKIEVSARHAHLSKEDLKSLFGPDYELKELKKLSQADDFAAMETVVLSTAKGSLEKVRIVGPIREKTQAEITRTEARALGLNPPLRVSGEVKGSEKITLIGPVGEVELSEGVIIAQRHLHASPGEAEPLGIKDQDKVAIKVEGERGLVFNEIIARVKDGYQLRLHIDTDEANAAGVAGGEMGEIIK